MVSFVPLAGTVNQRCRSMESAEGDDAAPFPVEKYASTESRGKAVGVRIDGILRVKRQYIWFLRNTRKSK